ncbi:MAG: serine kinase [Hyphomicrobiales bacterium]
MEQAGLRGFYHHEAPSWQLYDPLLRAGVHSLPYPMAVPPWETGSPLRLFLHWAYAHVGMRLTHAATLGIAGAGALIVGASGSGKSGTTMAGLLNGLQSAGDDYVLLEQGEDLTAHAVFRVFKQDSEGLRRVGIDPTAIGSTAVNWHGKHEFDAETLQPGGFVKRLSIRCILVPEVARLNRTYIEPLSAANAALALAPSAVLQLQGDTREGFRFFAQLSRRLRAFKVRLSEDPREIADAIGNHLFRETSSAD